MAVGRLMPSLGRYRGLFPPRSAPTSRAYCTLCGFTGGVVLLTAGSVFCSVIARHPQSGGHPMHTPPLPLALATILVGLAMVAASLFSIWRYGLDDGDDTVEDEAQFVVCSDTLDQLYQHQQMQHQLQQQQMLYHRLIETQLQRDKPSVEAANLQQQQQKESCCYNATHVTTTNHNQETNGCCCGANGSNTKDFISHSAPEAGCLESKRSDCNFVSRESQAQRIPVLPDGGFLPLAEGTFPARGLESRRPDCNFVSRESQARRNPVLPERGVLPLTEGALSGGPPKGTPMAVTASGTLVPSKLQPSTSGGDCWTPSSHPQKMASIIVANKDAIKVILDNS